MHGHLNVKKKVTRKSSLYLRFMLNTSQHWSPFPPHARYISHLSHTPSLNYHITICLINSNYKAPHYAVFSVDSHGMDAVMNNLIFVSQLDLSYVTFVWPQLCINLTWNTTAFSVAEISDEPTVSVMFHECAIIAFLWNADTFPWHTKKWYFSIIFWIRTTCCLDTTRIVSVCLWLRLPILLLYSSSQTKLEL